MLKASVELPTLSYVYALLIQLVTVLLPICSLFLQVLCSCFLYILYISASKCVVWLLLVVVF